MMTKDEQQRQTVKQYVASVRLLVPGVRHQTSVWPWPQSEQSHVAIWRDGDEQSVPYMIPRDAICVPVVNADLPGVLLRVHPDAPTPRQLANKIVGGIS